MDGFKSFLLKIKGNHTLMMAGCVALMAAFILFPLFGINIGNAGYILLLVICIPMHLLMIKSIPKKNKETNNPAGNDQEENNRFF